MDLSRYSHTYVYKSLINNGQDVGTTGHHRQIVDIQNEIRT